MSPQPLLRHARSILCSCAMLTGIVPVISPGAALAQSFQFVGGPGSEDSEPPINSRQLQRFAQVLGLDGDQQEAASALLEGMQTEWNTLSKSTREKMDAIREEFEESRDPSVFGERIPAIMRAQGEARGKLQQEFMSDFKALLTEEQTARWPEFERVHRRETTIRRGVLSGESVDLLEISDEMKLGTLAIQDLPDALQQYETDLDRALIERNKLVIEAQRRMGAGPFDPQAAAQDEEFQKLREQAREARLRVRDTNQRYARQIAVMLPDDTRAKFEEEVTRRSYPEVYRPSLASESFAAAEAFSDLTPEQSAAIKSMRDAYQQEADRATEQWRQAVEQFESTPEGYLSALSGGFRMRGFGPGGRGGESEPENPVDQARQSRRDIDRAALDKLKAILSDGQRERLPTRRERGGRGPRAMGSGAQTQTDSGDAALAEGEDVIMVRSVQVGPDGQTQESTGVFVQRSTDTPEHEGEGDEEGGEVVEHRVIVVPAPPAPPESPSKPE